MYLEEEKIILIKKIIDFSIIFKLWSVRDHSRTPSPYFDFIQRNKKH